MPAQCDLYEQLIREGAWWDLVDHVVGRCLSGLVLSHHAVVAAHHDQLSGLSRREALKHLG